MARKWSVITAYIVVFVVLLSFCGTIAHAQEEVPETTSESGIEYANPDDQHLTLSLWSPVGESRFRRSCVSTVVDFARGILRIMTRSAEFTRAARVCGRERSIYRLAPQYPFPRGGRRLEGGRAVVEGERREVPHRPGSDRCGGSSAGGNLAV